MRTQEALTLLSTLETQVRGPVIYDANRSTDDVHSLLDRLRDAFPEDQAIGTHLARVRMYASVMMSAKASRIEDHVSQGLIREMEDDIVTLRRLIEQRGRKRKKSSGKAGRGKSGSNRP